MRQMTVHSTQHPREDPRRNRPLDLLISGSWVVTPNGCLEANIGISDGTIVYLGNSLQPPSAELILDARGLHAFPGVVDGHVHFREPGLTHKEDFASGSAAAAFGGITTFVDMPNTIPPTSDAYRLLEKRELAEAKSYVDFGLAAILGAGSLPLVDGLAHAGAMCFEVFNQVPIYGVEPPDDGELYMLMTQVARTGLPLGLLPENQSIVRAVAESLRAQGRVDPEAWLSSRAPVAEVQAIASYLPMAAQTGCRIHLNHLSTRDGLDLIAKYRCRHAPVTAETTPLYLLMTMGDILRDKELLRISPPLRQASDCEALWSGLRAGTIDMVVSDHGPHTAADRDRKDIWQSVTGFAGVELLLPLMLSEALSGRIPLERLAYLLSEGPARVLGFYPRKGCLALGSSGDVTLVDLGDERVVDSAKLHSRGVLTPFVGRRLRGWPRFTVVRGCIVMADGELVGNSGEGRFIAPRSSEAHQ